MARYACNLCFIVCNDEDLDNDGNCPLCHEPVKKMCSRGPIRCEHDIVEGIAYCPDCGAAMCPKCECHNVSQVSRVTGYLADVAGWNEAKKQELKDRVKWEL